MLIPNKYNGYTRDGRRLVYLDFGGDSPPPPDYTPMANASKEAAEIAAKLGQNQLDEAKRQYDQNMETAKPLIELQGKTAQLAYDQGKQNYENFQTEGRPIQQAMRDISMGKLSPEIQGQMEAQAGRNVADVASSLDAQRASTGRAMARMGINPNSGKMAAANAEQDLGAAAVKAGAANQGRTQALDKSYARMGDTLNTYSGMASSAPNFYSASTNAGNSAVGNQNSTAAQYLNGMASGNSTIMGGQQLRMQGLGGILNSQTSYANSNQGEGIGSVLGGIGGAAAGFAKLYAL